MKKISIAYDGDSNKTYTNSDGYDISIRMGHIFLVRDDIGMSHPLPDRIIFHEPQTVTIIHDDYNIINVVNTIPPKNKVKKVFWEYGFRNIMYCVNRSDVFGYATTDSVTLVDSPNIVVCSKFIKTRLTAHKIWIDFQRISANELQLAINALLNSAMRRLSEVKYLFN
jgi:hypothetical protein